MSRRVASIDEDLLDIEIHHSRAGAVTQRERTGLAGNHRVIGLTYDPKLGKRSKQAKLNTSEPASIVASASWLKPVYKILYEEYSTERNFD